MMKKMFINSLLYILLQVQIAYSADFCPYLNCTEDLGNRICLSMQQGKQYIESFKMDQCAKESTICDIFDKKNLAWAE